MKTTRLNMVRMLTAALLVAAPGMMPAAMPALDSLTRNTNLLNRPLVWIGERTPDEGESQALLQALATTTAAERSAGLQSFIAANPQSAWTPGLRNQLAQTSRLQGRYSLALEHWQAAWETTKTLTDQNGRAVADEALAQWTRLLTSLGRTEELHDIFAATRGRTLSSREQRFYFNTAREAYATMVRYPAIAYRCGPLALRAVGLALQPENQDLWSLVEVSSTANGVSLATLIELSDHHQLGLAAAQRPAGDGQLVVPSVVHWSQNHYAAIVAATNGVFWVVDPTFGEARWMSAETINAEASGYFLVPGAQKPAAWHTLTDAEAGQVWGRGFYNAVKDGKDEGCERGTGGPKGQKDCPTCASGMPIWWVSEPYMNVWLADEPAPYLTSRGERMAFRLNFKQRDTLPETSTDLPSTGWNHNWLSYLRWWEYLHTLPPYSVYQQDMTRFMAGGGERAYPRLNGYRDESQARLEGIRGAGTSPWLVDLQPVTYLEGQTGYRLVYPDGTQDIYGEMHGLHHDPTLDIGWGYAFLTQHVDPLGYTNRFYYETNGGGGFRLHYMVDYDGRTNTLSYTNNNLVRAVQNPNGQTATFLYDSLGQITNLTDAAGLSTGVGYDTNGYVMRLVSPYGTTTFDYIEANTATNDNLAGHGVSRSVLVTQPDGSQAAYVYRYDGTSYLPATIPGGEMPTSPVGTLDDGTGGTNQFKTLQFRNSFYWGPKQFAALSTTNLSNLTSNDFRLARWKHWLRSVDDLYVSANLSFVREPSPDGTAEGVKTFYDYPGKIYSSSLGGYLTSVEGTNFWSTVETRQLPNGESQYSWTRFNQEGLTTNVVSTYTRSDGTAGTRTNLATFATNTITRSYWWRDDSWIPADYYNLVYTNYSTTWNLLTQLTDESGAAVVRLGEYAWITNITIVTDKISSSQTNLLKVITISQRMVPEAFTNALNETGRFTYDNRQHLTSVRDTAGHVLTNIYTSDGFLSQATDLDRGATDSFTYTNGLPLSHTDARGLARTFTWDNLLRLTSVSYPDSTTISNRYDRLDLASAKDRLGNWSYLGHDGLQRLVAFTNANSQVTRFGYCGCGTLETITNALSGITTLFYDNQLRRTGVTFPDTSGASYQFDSVGRLTNALDGAGRAVSYTYNHQGLVTAVSNAYGRVFGVTYDLRDRPVQMMDENGVTITNTFDDLHRLIARSGPDGGLEQWLWTPRGLLVYTNQLNQRTVFDRDVAGRLLAVTNANTEVTRFTYSVTDDLLSLVDGNQKTTQWSYDVYGRQTGKTNGLNVNTLILSYDTNHRLTNRWTAAKGNTAYGYDPVGNLTALVYPVTPSVTFAFDALNRLTNLVDAAGTTKFSYTALGQLVAEDGPWTDDTVSYGYTQQQRASLNLRQPNAADWQQSYSYDNARRLQTLTSPLGAFGYVYSGGANPTLSLVKKLTLPNGSYITNAFDGLARLKDTSMFTGANVVINHHGYGYDQWGQRTNALHENGWLGVTTTDAYTYDAIGQIKSVRGYEPDGTTQRLHEKLDYSYDAADNLTNRTRNALTQGFMVDGRNAMTNATRSGTLTVAGMVFATPSSVTVNGNAATVYSDNTFAKTGLTVTNGNNAFVAVGQDGYGRNATNQIAVNLPATNTFVSDANGNLNYDGVKALDYDDENQLSRVTVTNSWKSEFTYDGLRRRRIAREFTWTGSAWNQTNETRFVYDGALAIQERDANNLPKVTYTRGLDLSGSLQGAGGIGGLLARTDHSTLNPQSAFYHTDGAGNVTALVDGKQQLVASYLYDPFGNLLGLAGPQAAANRYRFSSKELHANSGLYSYGRRFYEPNLQRFINEDPISEAGGINLFRFVGNSPLNRIDPFGWDDITASGLLRDELGDTELNQKARGWRDQFVNGAKTAVDSVPLLDDAMVLAQGQHLSGDAASGTDKALAAAGVGGGFFSKAVRPLGKCKTVVKDWWKARKAKKAAEKAASKLKKLSRGELSQLISPEQRNLLGDLFGTGPEGARDSLEKLLSNGQLPDGLTKETLDIYKEIANKVIEQNIDKVGTQAERLKLIEEALKLLK